MPLAFSCPLHEEVGLYLRSATRTHAPRGDFSTWAPEPIESLFLPQAMLIWDFLGQLREPMQGLRAGSGGSSMLINVYDFPAGRKVQPANLVCENRKECELLTVSSLSLSLSLLPWDWELGYASCQEHSFLVNWLPLFLPFSKEG